MSTNTAGNKRGRKISGKRGRKAVKKTTAKKGSRRKAKPVKSRARARR